MKTGSPSKQKRPAALCSSALLAAVRRLIAANESLGQMVDGTTYYEASPSTNPECFKRWIELNHALKQARKAANSD